MRKSLGMKILITLLAISFLAVGCTGGKSGKEARGKIIGIDPGAGIMSSTERAMEEYGLDNFDLIEGSDATMAAALADAVKNEKWIVVTGWSPHWKFAKFDLKYLDDPKKVYGEAERIDTIVRKGLKEDLPDVYTFLDNFFWTLEDMQQIQVWNEEESDPYETAKRWINENEEKVNEWIEGLKFKEDAPKVELAYVEWTSEVASTNVVKAVLQEKLGYDVKITSVSAAAMWQAVATGDVDGSVSAWLPTTQGAYMEQFGDDLENLGPNLEGTILGLVVPEYVDIDSIEDLKTNADKFNK